uniref:SET domain-containing protein n=1 Tax=Minutocellus polymorphus TaxID=265543 RepID=A0A7S0FHG1_9STRA|mmetsp:Transcript_12557/g.20902  ORF Transcript_12557/g.20902 Transcript_12557/m.20902 type:complete len:338 (+) Transcript_12557:205-1218(+)
MIPRDPFFDDVRWCDNPLINDLRKRQRGRAAAIFIMAFLIMGFFGFGRYQLWPLFGKNPSSGSSGGTTKTTEETAAIRRINSGSISSKTANILFPDQTSDQSRRRNTSRLLSWKEFDQLGWEEIKNELGCEALMQSPRPVYTEEDWKLLRQQYETIAGNEASTIGDATSSENAFLVPHYAQQAGEKGRGIFAGRDIERGEAVYDFSRTAQFREFSLYRKWLYSFAFNEAPAMACDIMMWTYVQRLGDQVSEEDYRIMTDLDNGALCNDGYKKNGNIGFGFELNITNEWVEGKSADKISPPLVASRDIRSDEELLCHYGSFVKNGYPGWEKLGMDGPV